MPRVLTQAISQNECIGDSLSRINSNDLKLDENLVALSATVTSVENIYQRKITATDTSTIDVNLNTNNVFTANIRSNSIAYDRLTSGITEKLAKAWGSIGSLANGASVVPNVNGSFNIESVERITAEPYTYRVNFTTNLGQTNYTVLLTCGTAPGLATVACMVTQKNASWFEFIASGEFATGSGYATPTQVNFVVFDKDN